MILDLTIVVPTLNRTIFLKKLLNYYDKFKFSGEILILDSSKGKIKENNKFLCGSHKQLNIKYIGIKGFPHEVIKKCRKHIKSSYVVFSGDDDYFVVNALKNIVSYLKKNKKHISASGESILLHKPKKNSAVTYEYKGLHARLENTALERVFANITNYSVGHYAVCRKKFFNMSFKHINRNLCPSRIVNDEMLVTMSLSCLGKSNKILEPYLIRSVGHERNDLNKGILKKDLKTSLLYLIKILLQTISIIDNKNVKTIDRKKMWFNLNNFCNNVPKKNKLLSAILNFHASSVYFKFKQSSIFRPVTKITDLLVTDKFSFDKIDSNKKYYKDLRNSVLFLKNQR